MPIDRATDYTALTDAIRGVVESMRASGRALLRWGPHRDPLERVTPSDPPIVQVEFGVPRRHLASPLSRTGDYRIDDVLVTIGVLYHRAGGNALPVPLGGSADSVGTRALNLGARLVRKLTTPGELSWSPGGGATGLVDGCLQADEDAGEVVDEGNRYIVRHRFRAWVALQQTDNP